MQNALPDPPNSQILSGSSSIRHPALPVAPRPCARSLAPPEGFGRPLSKDITDLGFFSAALLEGHRFLREEPTLATHGRRAEGASLRPCSHEPGMYAQCCAMLRHRQALQPPAPQPSRSHLAPAPPLLQCATLDTEEKFPGHRLEAHRLGAPGCGADFRTACTERHRNMTKLLFYDIASSARGTCPEKVPQLRRLYVPCRASCSREAGDRTSLLLQWPGF